MTTQPGRVSRLEKILLSLLIFLIPSNLALHFTSLTQLVQGQLVDYLIPRLYLTDVLILALLGISIVQHQSKLVNKANKLFRSSSKSVFNPQLIIITFFALTLLTSIFAPNAPTALWFWLKLLEMLGLFLYLKHLRLYDFELAKKSGRFGVLPERRSYILYMISYILPLSVLFQSLLALTQYLKQGNVFPYWFLGESQFSATTGGIAKGALFGALKVLPYGTTPHPNVLAGFLAVSLVVLISIRRSRRETAAKPWRGVAILFGKNANNKSLFWTASKYITLLFGFAALLLTQSLSAIVIFCLAIAATSLPQYRSTRTSPLLKIGIPLAGIMALVWVGLFFKTSLEPESLSRRHSLNQAAIRIIAQNPLLGVGLNNFTAVLPRYGEVAGPIRFLQPVHNIYLLLASETGLIGFGIVVLLFWQWVKKSKFSILHSQFSIPLAMILIIGAVDHYPLTLQTGQLLTVLTIALVKPRTKT